jgi:hypothetical protein
MRNAYEIRGQDTVIFLPRRSGPPLETLVETADLPKLLALPCTWVAAWRKNTQSYYVLAVVNGTTIYLHRFIMEPPKRRVVDHKYHDTLDNRRRYLEVVTHKKNRKNRKPKLLTNSIDKPYVEYTKGGENY